MASVTIMVVIEPARAQNGVPAILSIGEAEYLGIVIPDSDTPAQFVTCQGSVIQPSQGEIRRTEERCRQNEPIWALLEKTDPDSVLVAGPADGLEGSIVATNLTSGTITLDTGEEFVVPEHELVQFEPGDSVLIPSYYERDGQRFAVTAIQLGASLASADEVTGEITNIDLTDNTFEVQGTLFTASPTNTVGPDLSELKEGDEVTVSYETPGATAPPWNAMTITEAE